MQIGKWIWFSAPRHNFGENLMENLAKYFIDIWYSFVPIKNSPENIFKDCVLVTLEIPCLQEKGWLSLWKFMTCHIQQDIAVRSAVQWRGPRAVGISPQLTENLAHHSPKWRITATFCSKPADCARLLLNAEAQVDAADKNGFTPLCAAAAQGHFE